MICHNCSKEIPDTAKVCGYCGTRQVVTGPPAPEPIPPPKVEEPAEIPVEEEIPKEEVYVPEPQASVTKPPVTRPPVTKPPAPAEAVEEQAVEAPTEPPEQEGIEAEVPPAPELTPQPTPPQVVYQPAPAEKKKGSVPVWVWIILGLVVIGGGFFLLGGPELLAAAPEPTRTSRPTATRRPAPTDEPEEGETLSGAFVGLELVEEIVFPNPDAGSQYEERSGGGVEVWGEGGDNWGWYELAHGLREGYAVFAKYRPSSDAAYALTIRNNSVFQAPGYRAWGIWQDEYGKSILIYTDEELEGVDEFPSQPRQIWYEVFFANLGDGWVLVREEGSYGSFYNYHEYLGEDFTDGEFLLELDINEGSVEIERVIIFTFGDIELD